MRAIRFTSIVVTGFICGCSAEPQQPDEPHSAMASLPLEGVHDTTASMSQARSEHVVVLLGDARVLACGGTSDGSSALSTCEVFNPASGRWSSTSSMNQSRRHANAVLLQDGTVLVCGGGTASCERYEVGTGAWAWAPAMLAARTRGTLTGMLSGKVLAVGGDAGGAAEVFDPQTQAWHAVGAVVPRQAATATRLGNGGVLFAGGTSGTVASTQADLFDPTTETWLAAAPLPVARTGHTATRLRDGRVWIAGGSDGSTEPAQTFAYDETLAVWKTTPAPLAKPRRDHAAVLLPSGRVVLLGGRAGGLPMGDVEVFDPVANQCTAAPALGQARALPGAITLGSGDVLAAGGTASAGPVARSERLEAVAVQRVVASTPLSLRVRHAQALLPDGSAMLTGGIDGYASTGANTIELYEPDTDGWAAGTSMLQARQLHSETLLPTGRVLVVGGYVQTNPLTYVSSAELGDPAAHTWAAAGHTERGRWAHSASLTPAGKLLVLCGADEYSDVTRVDRYDPWTGVWDKTQPMSILRTDCTGTVLDDGKMLVVGAGLFPGDEHAVEAYDETQNSWTNVAGTLAPREGHTATKLGDGRVLVVGGNGAGSATTTVEWYDAAANQWSWAAPLPDPRAGHAAVAMLDGRVLVIGGEPSSPPAPDRTLVFDPQASTWSSVSGVLSRTSFAAHPLGDGSVLAVGGFGPGESDRFSRPLGFQQTWRPVILDYPAAAAPGAVIRLQGSRFRGTSQASGGGGNGSASDTPLVSLLAFDGSAVRWLRVGRFADDHLYVELPSHAARGYYLLTVVVSGIPSMSVPLVIRGAIGDPCASGAGCLDGKACVDGACCATSSCPTCQSCGLPGQTGHCANLSVFVDDDVPPGACSGDKTCDGAGQCKQGPGSSCTAASQCAGPWCVDGVCCTTACGASCMACNTPGKAGACVFVPAGAPDPWPAASACSAPHACDGAGACKAGNGSLCAVPEECGSGYCADGVCCDTPCALTCHGCAVSGSEGACVPISAMSADPPTCSTGHSCDGAGACKTANGRTCTQDGDCASGHCADGVCCNEACSDACMTCGLVGIEGICSAVSQGEEHGGCAGTMACNGQGACKKKLGTDCTAADACLFGLCVDAVCCDRPCEGQCEACDVAGALGTCSPVDGAPHGTRPACAGPTNQDPCSASACLGAADSASCIGKVGQQTPCRVNGCANGLEVESSACDGSGVCPPAVTRACDLYVCGPTMCLTACVADDDCSDPLLLRCETSEHRCVAREGATCDGESSVVSPTGARTDCSPYRCSKGDGGGDRCLRVCASSADCVSGFVCDLRQGGGACVSAASDADEAGGGCGCRVFRPRQQPAWWVFAVAVWRLSLARKRRAR